MSGDRAGWQVVGASALGGRHVSTGAPNQDSSRWVTVDHRGEEVVILAVADGHGGSRYVRSDIGSDLAVTIACDIARAAVEAGLLDSSRREMGRRARQDLPGDIVSRWSQACLDHLATSPFTEEERARAGEDLDSDPLLAYGSTLLMAVLSADESLLFQLGDGDCLVADSEGHSLSPIPLDDRLTGGETTSLCLPDAAADFRVAVVGDIDPSLVLLATDGYGVAFADPGWRQTVVGDLLAEFEQRGTGYVEKRLPTWLEESARVGGDDATVAVAYRHRDAVSPAGSPATKRRLIRSRPAALAVATMFGLLVGGMAGWAWGAAQNGPDFEGDSPPVTMGPATTMPTPTQPPTTPPSPPSTVPGTIVPDDTGQGDETQGDVVPRATVAQAWIVGSGGQVVEFQPDPANPAPRLISPGQGSPGINPGQGFPVYLWGRLWSVAGGQLFSDGEPIGLVTQPEASLGALEVEAGYLWALSDDGRWLITLDFEVGECSMAEVEDPDGVWGEAEPRLEDVWGVCSLPVVGGS